METPMPKEIAAFIVRATKEMLESKEELTYYLIVADNVALVFSWEPGFDKDNRDKYVDLNGYGICWSFRQAHSSYFVSDWDYLSECGGTLIQESDEGDSFLEFAENLINEYPEYFAPKVLITLPTGEECNILDDACWVSQDDELKYEEKDLTQLWWYYQGWAISGRDKENTEKTLMLWSMHLADYYGMNEALQMMIPYNELTMLIYNALIKLV